MVTHCLIQLNLLGAPYFSYSSWITPSVVWDLVLYTNRQMRVSISIGFVCVWVVGGGGCGRWYHTI